MKAVFEACSANKKSIECVKKGELRTAESTARLDNSYYTKNTEERAALDTAQATANAAKAAEVKAAWLAENEPAPGTTGGAC